MAPTLAASVAAASAEIATSAPPAAASATPDVGDQLPAELAALPALSEDGSRVALLASYEDGARALPNRELLVLDVARGTVLERFEIEDPDLGLDPPDPVERLELAARLLRTQTWRPLERLEMVADTDLRARTNFMYGQDLFQAKGAGFTIRYHEPKLMIDDNGKRVLNRAFASWSDKGGKKHPLCPDCHACPPTIAGLAEAFVEKDARVALLVVTYHFGSDMCWEPDRTYHVFRF
ncbi:MAG: hypothetical protein HOW73_51115 [Polyangiaceae bacterium]|nr:hypothetical protein [Polyangiaceae bacterium]